MATLGFSLLRPEAVGDPADAEAQADADTEAEVEVGAQREAAAATAGGVSTVAEAADEIGATGCVKTGLACDAALWLTALTLLGFVADRRRSRDRCTGIRSN